MPRIPSASSRSTARPAFVTLSVVRRFTFTPVIRTEIGLARSWSRPTSAFAAQTCSTSSSRPPGFRTRPTSTVRDRIWHGAEDEGADHLVEALVAELQGLHVAQTQIDVHAQRRGSAHGAFEHLRREVDRRDLGLGRIAREVLSSADADLEHARPADKRPELLSPATVSPLDERLHRIGAARCGRGFVAFARPADRRPSPLVRSVAGRG